MSKVVGAGDDHLKGLAIRLAIPRKLPGLEERAMRFRRQFGALPLDHTLEEVFAFQAQGFSLGQGYN